MIIIFKTKVSRQFFEQLFFKLKYTLQFIIINMKGNSGKRKQTKKGRAGSAQDVAIENVQLDFTQSQFQKLDALYKQHSQNKQVSFYDQLKYKGQLFDIGKFFSLYNSANQLPHIVKLKNIIQLPSSVNALPFIQVELYLRKEDLPVLQKYEKYYQHISKAQLFPSGKFICVQVQAIDRQVSVISNKEYENLAFAYDYIFYTRAAFDPFSNSLIPDPSKWQSSCICQMPVNPQMNYIQCESCQLWFHTKCVLKEKKIKEEEDYVCDKCRQAQVLKKNSKKNQESSVERQPIKSKKSKEKVFESTMKKSKEKIPQSIKMKRNDIEENKRPTRSKS